ncbi:MerC family mercury resistance protein [Brevundimonas sp. NPDC003935]|uniref:MerC family mercury resistance protein n=1 Tax=unclassified Brevundimonas TaxID=2622653 RepID=UPI0028994A83|nr:MerC family mercury resistance protein [Brevundimonas sp.]
MTARIQTWGDAAAIGLSALCMIHCLALPLLAAALPFLGLFTETPWLHWVFAATAAPIAAWNLSRPMTDGHRNWRLLSLGSLGVLLLFLAAAEWPSHELEKLVTIAGGLVLAAAHGLNWRKRSHEH